MKLHYLSILYLFLFFACGNAGQEEGATNQFSIKNTLDAPRKDALLLLDARELASGMRLACIHQIEGDCRIAVPPVESGELLDDL